METAQAPATIRFGWLSVIQWVVFTSMGFLLGILLHFPGDSTFSNFNAGAAAFGFILGAISGLITASFQAIVLKPWLRSSWLWLALNALGWGLVHAINDGILLRPQATFALAAAIIAVVQTLALRDALSNALLWLPVAFISWLLGFQLGYTLFDGEDPGNLVAAGLTVGIMTGVALRFLLPPTMLVVSPNFSSEKTRGQHVAKLAILTLLTITALILLTLATGINPFG